MDSADNAFFEVLCLDGGVNGMGDPQDNIEGCTRETPQNRLSELEKKCIRVIASVCSRSEPSGNKLSIDADLERAFIEVAETSAQDCSERSAKLQVANAYLDLCNGRDNLTTALLRSICNDVC